MQEPEESAKMMLMRNVDVRRDVNVAARGFTSAQNLPAAAPFPISACSALYCSLRSLVAPFLTASTHDNINGPRPQQHVPVDHQPQRTLCDLIHAH